MIVSHQRLSPAIIIRLRVVTIHLEFNYMSVLQDTVVLVMMESGASFVISTATSNYKIIRLYKTFQNPY